MLSHKSIKLRNNRGVLSPRWCARWQKPPWYYLILIQCHDFFAKRGTVCETPRAQTSSVDVAVDAVVLEETMARFSIRDVAHSPKESRRLSGDFFADFSRIFSYSNSFTRLYYEKVGYISYFYIPVRNSDLSNCDSFIWDALRCTMSRVKKHPKANDNPVGNINNYMLR